MKYAWQIKSLGDICNVVNGGTPKTNVKEYWGGKHLWVTPAEMGKRLSPYIEETERKLTDRGLCNCSAQMVPPYSVILSTRAPIGHLVINTELMATNQGCKSLVPKNAVHYKYLYYYLSSIIDLLNSLGTGTTFKELSGGKLKEVRIPLPPLSEQQRIVGVLDKTFEGIATVKAHAERNFKKAQEMLEGSLNKTFSGQNEEWIKTTIGDCIRFIDYRGKTPVKADNGIRLITAKNVKMGYLQDTPLEFVAPQIYDKWMTRGIPQRGDILFTTEAPLGNIAQLDTDEKVVFAQRIIIMQPRDTRLDRSFLKYLLLSPPIQTRIRKKGTGATVQGIKSSLLKTIDISFPQSIRKQFEIVSRLDALTSEVAQIKRLYRRKIEAFEALKQSLLHQAFTGNL